MKLISEPTCIYTVKPCDVILFIFAGGLVSKDRELHACVWKLAKAQY